MRLASWQWCWRSVSWEVHWDKRNLSRHIRKRRLFRVYFCKGIRFTHVFCSGQEARYVNTFFEGSDECVSVWVSVREWYAIVCFPPLAIQAVPSHFSVLSSHSFRQSFLPLRHQRRPAWASLVTESWMILLTWALGILSNKENPPYVRVPFWSWMKIRQDRWDFSSTGLQRAQTE